MTGSASPIPRSTPAVLTCDAVSFRCLRDVHFSVGRGETVVVLGRSGSGKTSFLRLLNRFDDPTSGAIRFHGAPLVDLDPLDLRRRVALVMQTPVVFDGTVEDNLRVRPSSRPVPEPERLRGLLEEVGLGQGVLNRPASDLSVGEKQRVALGRTLLGDPEVLLLDEPTSALDPATTARVADMLSELTRRRGLSLVVVTHQADLVRRLGGRVLLLAEGTLSDAGAKDVERFMEGHEVACTT